MKKIILFILLFLLIGFYLFGEEQSQVRIIINGEKQLGQNSGLWMRFVFPDIVKSSSPVVYFGPKLNISENFNFSLLLGKNFNPDSGTLIVSFYPVFKFKNLVSWNEIEYRFDSRDFYSFLEIRHPVTNWMKVGIDSENVMGGSDDFYSAGPAIDFVLSNHMAITFGLLEGISGRPGFFRFYLKVF